MPSGLRIQNETYSKLRWNRQEHTHSTTLVDLQITITNNKLKRRTYQKPINLYLCIPPLSTHPTNCFKGLIIIGEIFYYSHQNSDVAGLSSLTASVFKCLVNRGHQIHNLIAFLGTAASSLVNDNSIQYQKYSKPDEEDDTLLIHWKFHPEDINKRTIRTVCYKILKGERQLYQQENHGIMTQ
jgi:hypothetical protein